MAAFATMKLLLQSICIALGCLALRLPGATVEDFLDRDQLAGNLWGLRDGLEENGIDLTMGYDGEAWSNTHGGLKTGSRLLGLGTVATNFDLETIAGLKGSSFYADGIWYYGTQPTADLIGDDVSSNISGAEADSNFWRFYQLYFRQSFNDESLVVHIGQLTADETFMVSEYASLFINAQFGSFPSMADNLNAPIYPLAAPGVYIDWEPKDSPWFARLGLYSADAGQDSSSNIGFDWSLGGGAGLALFLESGRHYTLGSLPGTATLGFIGANNEILNYRTGQTDRGYYSVYLMVDQVLTQTDDGDPRLAAFTRFAYNPQGSRTEQQYYLDAGFNLFHPFPNRPLDKAGIAVGYENFYGYYQASLRAAGQTITRDQAIVELTYQASLKPWLVVQPDFQIVVDPEFSGQNAYVVGIRASVIF